MAFTQSERMKCISNTLRHSFYIGMALLEHKIEKVIRTSEGMIIYRGELTLKHIPTETIFKLVINSDDVNQPKPKDGRTYGYVEQVLKKNDEGSFIEISAYEVEQIMNRWQ